MTRTLSWFSCGAASAVASKLAIAKYGTDCEVVYCDTSDTEHPDNMRFLHQIEEWLGQSIKVIKSDRYTSVDDVIEKRRYMAGVAGALCTVEMKKMPRFAYQDPDDIHVFGYTSEEQPRIQRIREANPELRLDFTLAEAGLTKRNCWEMLLDVGIELPAMYRLGYKNNNCLGCVKATSSKYWRAIRHDFPEVFEKRVAQSRELNVRLAYWKGKRVFLDELPAGYDEKQKNGSEDLSCGPECAASLEELSRA